MFESGEENVTRNNINWQLPIAIVTDIQKWGGLEVLWGILKGFTEFCYLNTSEKWQEIFILISNPHSKAFIL